VPVEHRLDPEVRRKLAKHIGEPGRVDRPLAGEDQIVEPGVVCMRAGADRPVVEIP